MNTLLLLGTAWSLDWWVTDEEQAEELEGALDELWPGNDVEVRVGPPGGRGVWAEDESLVLVVEEGMRQGPLPEDPWTQVALVRAWLREPELSDATWVPTEGQPTTPTAEAPSRLRAVTVSLGPGIRPPDVAAPMHAVVDLAWTSERWSAGLGAVADMGLVARYPTSQGGALVGRYGLVFPVAHAWPMGDGALELALAPALHLVLMRDYFERSVRELHAGLGAAARMRWWSAYTANARLGVGLAVSVDDAFRVRSFQGQVVQVAPMGVHLEFCLDFRSARGGA